MVKKALSLVVLFLLFSHGVAQKSDVLEPWLELIQKDPTLAEILTELLEDPIAVNDASKEEWQRLPLLTSEEIDSILNVRSRQGVFRSIRQLRTIIGAEKYKKIKPFLTLKRRKNQIWRLTQRNAWSIETPDEIKSKKFNGNKVYNLSRLQFKIKNKWAAALIAQKDVGEASYTDYWNGFIAYYSKNWQWIAGSYYLQLGQGLLFTSPFGRVKSAMSMLPFQGLKNSLHPYSGTSENFAQTGLCFKISFKNNTELIIFGANNLRDGRYNVSTFKIVGFDFSGYHRSQSEESKKDLIQEKIIGLSVQSPITSRLLLQFSTAQINYQPPIDFNAQNVSWNELRKDYFHFKGRRLSLVSLAYDFRWWNLMLSGETAFSKQGSPAFTQSGWWRYESFQIGLMFWNLSRNFQSPYARAFDEASPFPRAIRGLYFAWAYQKEHWEINMYKMLKKELWRTVLNSFPRVKDEWLVNLKHTLKTLVWQTRWRQKTSMAETGVTALTWQKTNDWRMELKVPIEKKVEFKSRVEWLTVQNLAEKGVLNFQQLRWQPWPEFSLVFRITFFQTDSYHSRIYEYETDIPGSFANFPLYGRGFKWFVQWYWNPVAGIKIWLKFRYSRWSDRNLKDVDYGKVKNPLNRMLRLQLQLNL